MTAATHSSTDDARRELNQLAIAIAGGVGYLKMAAGRRGEWQAFRTPAGESDSWVTAMVAANLGAVAGTEVLRAQAAAFLLGTQRRSGGWAFNVTIPTDSDSTAWALLALLATRGTRPLPIRRGVRALLSSRDEHGAIRTFPDLDAIGRVVGAGGPEMVGWGGPHVCVNGAVTMALLASGVEAALFQGAIDLLERTRGPRDVWHGYWWAHPAYATYHALLGLRWARRIAPSACAAAARGLLASEDDLGSCLPAFERSWLLLVVVLASEDVDLREAARRIMTSLLDEQHEDGSWTASPILRIAPPHVDDPDRWPNWQDDVFGTGVVLTDQNRCVTTSCVVRAPGAAP